MDSKLKNINIENYNFGNKKVAFFTKNSFGDHFNYPKNLEIIAKHNKLNIFLFDIKDDKIFGRQTFYMQPDFFELYFQENVSDYQKYYELLIKKIKEERIELCLFCGNVIPRHHSFLSQLQKYTKIASRIGDDDVEHNATRISKPYVKNFDRAFCCSVYYKGDEILMKDKYKERGAKNSEFIPLGLCHNKFDETKIPDFKNRDIDLLYVGGCYGLKVMRIFKLKRYFGKKMTIYGRGWNESTSRIKTIVLKTLKFIYKVPFIKELPIDNKLFLEVYNRSKIGFNLHQDYGPTNVRMYELPANGVMQICDNPKGLSKLFSIGKEVIGYTTLKEAIKKIEYYLKHDDERIKIAKAGYDKTINNYKVEQSFEKIINLIFK